MAELAHRLGLFRIGRGLGPRSLTVVNYHRIDDVHRPGFDSFKPNVSADPALFGRQIEYLKKWFNVITLQTLVDWLDRRTDLPEYTALITFDDGYLDNYTHAYPLLRQHGLPALVFLTVGHIGTDAPFSWDLAAYCFYHTTRDRMTFPDGRERHWADPAARDAVIKEWVEALKPLSGEENRQWTTRLPELLNVSIPHGYFQKLMLDWSLVREMAAGGISFGGHTVTHPILTRIPEQQARAEIHDSKAQIEEETGKSALSFAYPNGMSTDFGERIISTVSEAGYRAAFTLLNGPATWEETRRGPLEIRRVFISHRHSLSDFAALLSPLNRLAGG